MPPKLNVESEVTREELLTWTWRITSTLRNEVRRRDFGEAFEAALDDAKSSALNSTYPLERQLCREAVREAELAYDARPLVLSA